MEQVVLKVSKINQSIPLPQYESEGAAGMDLRAFLENDFSIPPLGRKKIPTGLKIEIPAGFEGQIRSRSGLAVNHGVSVLNSPGTIDSDYRGELEIILINLGEKTFTVKNNDRIAQLIISPVVRAALTETDDLSGTQRGSGGFGSTGL